MPFLGKVKEISGTPSDIRGLRGQIAGTQGFGGVSSAAINRGAEGVPNVGAPQDDSFFFKHLLQPYIDLFSAERSRSLAQAKESAGNLTGSGFQNIFGSSLATSLAGEQKTLADALFGTRQQGIDIRGQDITQRGQTLTAQDAFLRNMLAFASGGVSAPTSAYQPGVFDAIAPIIGQGIGAYLGRPSIPAAPAGK